jgi:hypothetical protein
MRILLWDMMVSEVAKESAGGMGIRRHQSTRHRFFSSRKSSPVALIWARLAAIFKRLGHTVAYQDDSLAREADLYVFCPSLISFDKECETIDRLLRLKPDARIWVAGPVASALPEPFLGRPGVTLLRGEAEALYETFGDVLSCESSVVHLGVVDSFDILPPADWYEFKYKSFRLPRELGARRAGLIEFGRASLLDDRFEVDGPNDPQSRYRDPESVADEMVHGATHWGFRGFKFCDPQFGADLIRTSHLADCLGRLPQEIAFSIECQATRMSAELLRMLARAGLKSVCCNLQISDHFEDDFEHFSRLIEAANQLNIRTIGRFWFGHADESYAQSDQFLSGAFRVRPTYSEFRLVTPFPGTPFYRQMQRESKLAHTNWTRFDTYGAVLRYENHSADELEKRLHDAQRRSSQGRKGSFVKAVFNQWRSRWDLADSRSPLEISGVKTDPAHTLPPRPISAMQEIMEKKGLRMDGPHLCDPSRVQTEQKRDR